MLVLGGKPHSASHYLYWPFIDKEAMLAEEAKEVTQLG